MNSQLIMIPLASIFLILPNLFLLFAATNNHDCTGTGNYTSNSTYKTNLDALLSTLPTNIDPYGFYSASSTGQPLDQANAIVLCRGDANLDACRHCVRAAASDLTNSFCPNRKEAITWYDDSTCTLWYSNRTIFGTSPLYPRPCICNALNATSPDQFNNDLRTLLDDVRSKALNGGARRKFATGNISGPNFQTIFALAQCTPYLTTIDCNDCLSGAAADISQCCDSRRGGRVLLSTCSLRYEIYSFFNQVLVESDQEPPTGKDNGNKTRIIVIVAIPITVVCVIIAIFMGIWLTMRRKQKEIMNDAAMGEISTVESLQYSYSIIKAATNDFSDDNKLGEGGFGVVYKGVLPDGREIAAKRFSHNSTQGYLEFKTEALLLAKLLHRNLVKLMGFCHEGPEKILVYEFVLNGSLDRFIFDPVNRAYLDWDKRFKIIWGIARGLLYLHEDSQLKIIHRDLKASNVLLDSKMSPKIADFGLAKLFEQDETQGKTNRIIGTYGYMAPEYAIQGKFSVKSDVFSFGVLVLEIVSGRRNTSTQSEDNTTSLGSLLSFVWKNWRDETYVNIVDSCLRSGSSFMGDILRCIQIGLLCVQQNAKDRPTMASVVLMLTSFSITMRIPSEPAFLFGISDHSSSLEVDNLSNAPNQPHIDENASKNEVSVSDFGPR